MAAAAILHCRDLVMSARGARSIIFLRPAGERQDYKSRDRSEQRDNSLGQTNFPGRREESNRREGRTNSQTQHTPSRIINGETLSCKSHGAHSRARCRLRSNIFYICCRGCCQFTRASARASSRKVKVHRLRGVTAHLSWFHPPVQSLTHRRIKFLDSLVQKKRPKRRFSGAQRAGAARVDCIII